MKNERKNLLVFGYGLSVILAFFSIRLGLEHGWSLWSYLLIAASIAFAGVTRRNLDILKPFYHKWMKVAHCIGTVVTGVILSVVFYLIFGVAGIVLRILRKDLLDRKIDRTRDSYWIKREEVVFDQKHYLRQF